MQLFSHQGRDSVLGSAPLVGSSPGEVHRPDVRVRSAGDLDLALREDPAPTGRAAGRARPVRCPPHNHSLWERRCLRLHLPLCPARCDVVRGIAAAARRASPFRRRGDRAHFLCSRGPSGRQPPAEARSSASSSVSSTVIGRTRRSSRFSRPAQRSSSSHTASALERSNGGITWDSASATR